MLRSGTSVSITALLSLWRNKHWPTTPTRRLLHKNNVLLHLKVLYPIYTSTTKNMTSTKRKNRRRMQAVKVNRRRRTAERWERKRSTLRRSVRKTIQHEEQLKYIRPWIRNPSFRANTQGSRASHILRLPTELRWMILEYCMDETFLVWRRDLRARYLAKRIADLSTVCAMWRMDMIHVGKMWEKRVLGENKTTRQESEKPERRRGPNATRVRQFKCWHCLERHKLDGQPNQRLSFSVHFTNTSQQQRSVLGRRDNGIGVIRQERGRLVICFQSTLVLEVRRPIFTEQKSRDCVYGPELLIIS